MLIENNGISKRFDLKKKDPRTAVSLIYNGVARWMMNLNDVAGETFVSISAIYERQPNRI
jgi:hypothetical protein